MADAPGSGGAKEHILDIPADGQQNGAADPAPPDNELLEGANKPAGKAGKGKGRRCPAWLPAWYGSADSLHLFHWIFRSFFRSALIPLLLVECVLIAAYVAANRFVYNENTSSIRVISADELSRIATREAAVIDMQLEGIMSAMRVFTDEVLRSLVEPLEMSAADRAFHRGHYNISEDLTLYKLANDGLSAVYYSGITPKTEVEWEKVLKTERFDFVMKATVAHNPLVVQAYFNSFDSLNRIYPVGFLKGGWLVGICG